MADSKDTPQENNLPYMFNQFLDKKDQEYSMGNNAHTDLRPIFYKDEGPQPLVVSSHFFRDGYEVTNEGREHYNPDNIRDTIGHKPSRTEQTYLFNTEDHFIYDSNEPYDPDHERFPKYIKYGADGQVIRPFSGSATPVNPANDPGMEKIIDEGLHSTEKQLAHQYNNDSTSQPPISPIHPFTRMDPNIARRSLLTSYNRTHIPIADAEFRKGYRHVFITRPECYITCVEGGLSEQAKFDEDFASIYTRMPYILEILSPRYLVSDTLTNDGLVTNWNFLLSNRITGMQVGTTENNVMSSGTKTMSGFSVNTGGAITSIGANKLNLTFQETKNFEVYEMLRMWMLYISKRHVGAFAPPFNGYKYHNDFGGTLSGKKALSQPRDDKEGTYYDEYVILHPYDRALEYPCTIFDIITNESDTKILYWCAYIGAFPSTLSSGLNNDNNAAIAANLRTSATFQYQFKIENNNKMLALFNYNAGLINAMGQLNKGIPNPIPESLPFLLKEATVKPSNDFVGPIASTDGYAPNNMLSDYIGAAGMFVGSPYIVIGKSAKNPIKGKQEFLYTPYLKFAPFNVISSSTAKEFNNNVNLGINNIAGQKDTLVGIGIDTADYSSIDTKINPGEYTFINKDDSLANKKKGVIGQVTDYLSDQMLAGENMINSGATGLVEIAKDIGSFFTEEVPEAAKETWNNKTDFTTDGLISSATGGIINPDAAEAAGANSNSVAGAIVNGLNSINQ